jgi:pyridoxal 5'-phosphate synthase pdxS subunit
MHSGSGIFESSDPVGTGKAIVEAVTHFNNPAKLAEISTGLGTAMRGDGNLTKVEQYSKRGW